MEARAEYLGRPVERPRLTVVRDGAATYSALPHAIMRDTSLSRDARLLYAVLQSYAWQGGECRASHETMATEMGCSPRMLRRYLNELIAAGSVIEHDAGHRRQKTYRLSAVGHVVPIEPVNKTPVSSQSDTGVRFNKTPVSDSKKKTPEKKKLEEELATTLLVGAHAPEPAPAETRAKKTRGTRCPETFPLEEQHFEYAHGLGLDRNRTCAETDKFLAHHRFKGTLGVDWYAGWQNWMRRAVTYEPPRSNPPANAASKASHAVAQRAPLNVKRY